MTRHDNYYFFTTYCILLNKAFRKRNIEDALHATTVSRSKGTLNRSAVCALAVAYLTCLFSISRFLVDRLEQSSGKFDRIVEQLSLSFPLDVALNRAQFK